jgi:transglutaminase-like putative cysteine protease
MNILLSTTKRLAEGIQALFRSATRWVKLEIWLAGMIALLTAGFVCYKVQALGYTMTTIRPEKGYFVRLVMEVEANNQPVRLEVTLPVTSERQRILQEQQSADGFRYTITTSREGRWQLPKLEGKSRITYSFFAQTESREYHLPTGIRLPVAPPGEKERIYLEATERIQAGDPEIVAKARELMPDGMELATALRRTFDYVYQGVSYEKVRGPTDAVTALRLQQASCNGKNRLLVGLLRARGIPARMAKGLILRNTQKRTTHAWTEVLVGTQWIPFCPTSGYFAQIPEHYLELGKDDTQAFTHSRHIKFDWKWIIQPQTSATEQAVWNNVNNPLNVLNHWVSMREFHIPLRLIMIVLLVPIAGSVITAARNIVGLVPFGTFMPALIAVSFQETGFLLGSTMFLFILLVTSGMNFILVRLKLLHIPRLVIVLTIVVMSLMVFSILCLKLGFARGAGISMFPMAILSLTSERFTQTVLEDSWREAFKRILVTYVISAGCFLVISRQSLQIIIAAFPELLLLNIAFNLLIGSWPGLRLLEYVRFKWVLTAPTPSGRYA